MGFVYKHGLFNIAAASAADSSERLFGFRDPHPYLPDVWRMSLRESPDSVYWYSDDRISELRDTIESIWQSPLFQRAWVFQETLLSSRAVVFSQDEIHFRCAEEISIESLPTDHPLREVDIIRNAFEKQQRLITSMKYLSREDMAKTWTEVVRLYCDTSITRASDRLIAISAIARCFGSLKQSPYHAGLWEDTFIDDLTWSTNDPQTRSGMYVAPSWSWASLCGQERFCLEHISNGEDALQIPKILEVRTKSSGEDEFGSIDNGCLRICAPLYYMGHGSAKHIGSTFHQRTGLRAYHIRVRPDYDWRADEVPPIIFALPLQLVSRATGMAVSLLLLVAVTPAESMYKRVGFCFFEGVFSSSHLFQLSGEQSASERLEKFHGRMERQDEDIHSHERTENGWHTITII
jgi:hypothetical protein